MGAEKGGLAAPPPLSTVVAEHFPVMQGTTGAILVIEPAGLQTGGVVVAYVRCALYARDVMGDQTPSVHHGGY